MFGPYAGFVVPSYLISAVAILFAVFLIRRSFSQLKAELTELQKSQDENDTKA